MTPPWQERRTEYERLQETVADLLETWDGSSDDLGSEWNGLAVRMEAVRAALAGTPHLTVGLDYPRAWAFVKQTRPEDHHPRCSWRTEGGAFLCDCDVILEEHVRRGGADPRSADEAKHG